MAQADNKIVRWAILSLVRLALSFKSPFWIRKRQGYLRGFEFYQPIIFFNTLVNAAMHFERIHGVLPNIVHPKGFNEKIFRAKFFSFFKVPQAGNKLLTKDFIPLHLQDYIEVPEIVWHSTRAVLPSNEEMQAGYYYLKSNHGSGRVLRLQYPLTDETKRAHEKIAANWLAHGYGLKAGEWWYNAFPRELLLEQDIEPGVRSVSWGFFMFSGELQYITAIRKLDSGTEITRFDERFNLLNHAAGGKGRTKDLVIPDVIKDSMPVVKAISQPYNHVRVDCMVGGDGKLYLNEMTFSTGNGLTKRPKEIDDWMGRAWTNLD